MFYAGFSTHQNFALDLLRHGVVFGGAVGIGTDSGCAIEEVGRGGVEAVGREHCENEIQSVHANLLDGYEGNRFQGMCGEIEKGNQRLQWQTPTKINSEIS